MSILHNLIKPINYKISSFSQPIVRFVNSVRKAVITAVLQFTAYWFKPSTGYAYRVRFMPLNPQHGTKRLITAAFLSALAVIMQSAGVLWGPGFIISSMVTLPIAIATIMSLRAGAMAYITTLLLLVIIQPSELIIFPFTTGLLGLGIGISLKIFKKRASVIAFSAFSLTLGITVLLYGFKFPVLGPLVPGKPSLIPAIYAFSFLYSWLWVELCIAVYRFFNKYRKIVP